MWSNLWSRRAAQTLGGLIALEVLLAYGIVIIQM
jgi:hypothetical protein